MQQQNFDFEIKQQVHVSNQSLEKDQQICLLPSEAVVKAEAQNSDGSNDDAIEYDRHRDCHEASQTTQRASFRYCLSPPPVLLECRVLQSLNQQKSLRLSTKKEGSKAKPCNETKNIAKNYGKAIIAYIHNNRKMFRKICKGCSTPYQRVAEDLPQLKATLSTVTGFRKIWTEYRYSECIRRVSNLFLRKVALSYIFNSKIDNYKSHIKYRTKFLESLKDPQNFDHLKDY